MNSILEANLEYHRGGFTLRAEFVLHDQWTVLFGASGAGKTTLLRIVAGLTTPSNGSIQLGKKQILDAGRNFALPPDRREIGFVLQQAALFPHLTVRENIAFGLHRWAKSARENRTQELLDLFEIETMAERKPRHLSGGERQRVAVAQALAPRPNLLLLDEPFNALDMRSRAGLIAKVRSAAVPVLYVSHDLVDAWQMNADAMLLDSGKIVARGETRTILAAQRRQILDQLGVPRSSPTQA